MELTADRITKQNKNKIYSSSRDCTHDEDEFHFSRVSQDYITSIAR